ncbi:MAG: M23 family metallopeptidase [Armatimonadetes bacterium]|nr:M23 family metallopeptidase [Armatimonadota bacterium]
MTLATTVFLLALRLPPTQLLNPPSVAGVEYDGVTLEPISVDMVFPVAGECHWEDSFLAPRDHGRRHHGEDLLAPKMTPLVAAFDGTVYLSRGHGNAGYSVTLNGDNGYRAFYAHLNIDRPGTADGSGLDEYAFAEGLKNGDHVSTGQLLGYVGDSGNARGGATHCHFELSDPAQRVFNPAPSLSVARRILAPLGVGLSELATTPVLTMRPLGVTEPITFIEAQAPSPKRSVRPKVAAKFNASASLAAELNAPRSADGLGLLSQSSPLCDIARAALVARGPSAAKRVVEYQLERAGYRWSHLCVAVGPASNAAQIVKSIEPAALMDPGMRQFGFAPPKGGKGTWVIILASGLNRI